MSENYMDGKMLIAMPGIGDERFERAVVFICAHSSDGAMGLVINHQVEDLSLSGLLERLDLLPEDDAIRLHESTAQAPVLQGGPVETSRGFVLHTRDYFADECTLEVSGRIGLTATLDVLRDIAKGKGPVQSMLALGYSGWGPGQLESEIRQNGWLHCDCDESLLFSSDLTDKYERALASIGVSEEALSFNSFGHA